MKSNWVFEPWGKKKTGDRKVSQLVQKADRDTVSLEYSWRNSIIYEILYEMQESHNTWISHYMICNLVVICNIDRKSVDSLPLGSKNLESREVFPRVLKTNWETVPIKSLMVFLA
jgi:hypothetical protein